MYPYPPFTILALRQMDGACHWSPFGFCACRGDDRRLACHRTGIRIQRHLATADQYGHDSRHISDGVSHPEHAKPREAPAVHLKLDKLIRTVVGAHNALLDLEELTENDLERLRSSVRIAGA
jgi:low affinity iron permease